MRKGYQSGISSVLVIIIAAVVIVGGGTAAYFLTDGFGASQKTDDQTSNPKEVIEKNKPTKESTRNNQPPSNMPNDMPIYQPSELLTSSNKDDGGFSLGLNTKDSEDTVVSWYKQQLTDSSWEVKESNALSGMLNIKKDGFSGSITIHESTTTDTGTTISYLIHRQ